MRRLLLAAVAAASLLAGPALTSAKTNVYYPGCAGGGAPEIKPRSVIIACGDGNFQLAKMKWSSWGSSKAVGAGTAKVNTCTPNCAEGKFKSYKVDVTLTKPKSCNGIKIWTRLSVDFKSTKPSGFKDPDKEKLICSPIGQQQ
jgi:hypothetical protein